MRKQHLLLLRHRFAHLFSWLFCLYVSPVILKCRPRRHLGVLELPQPKLALIYVLAVAILRIEFVIFLVSGVIDRDAIHLKWNT